MPGNRRKRRARPPLKHAPHSGAIGRQYYCRCIHRSGGRERETCRWTKCDRTKPSTPHPNTLCSRFSIETVLREQHSTRARGRSEVVCQSWLTLMDKGVYVRARVCVCSRAPVKYDGFFPSVIIQSRAITTPKSRF